MAAKQAEPEKVTINLGHVDLGRIDVLVREGCFANRSDFIRTAIRNQLRTERELVDRVVERTQLDVGLRDITREELEQVRKSGEMLRIRALGLVRIAADVSAKLALETIESLTVLGTLSAPASVKTALRDRLF